MQQNITPHNSELSTWNQLETTQSEIWEEIDDASAQDKFGGWGSGGNNGFPFWLMPPGFFWFISPSS
jgi:hypothetical protein